MAEQDCRCARLQSLSVLIVSNCTVRSGNIVTTKKTSGDRLAGRQQRARRAFNLLSSAVTPAHSSEIFPSLHLWIRDQTNFKESLQWERPPLRGHDKKHLGSMESLCQPIHWEGEVDMDVRSSFTRRAQASLALFLTW